MKLRTFVWLVAPTVIGFLTGGGFPALAEPIRYSATSGDITTTSATTKFTLQQPASGARAVTGEYLLIYCAGTCKIQQSQNGGGATGTPTATTAILPNSGSTAHATFWVNSNVAGGTNVGGIIRSAGGTTFLDITKIRLPMTGINSNYTVAVTANVGDVINVSTVFTEDTP